MKWSGIIGFEELELSSSGVYTPHITEKTFKGDILRNYRKVQPGENFNDNFVVSDEISIIADPYSLKNFYRMKYVTYMGQKWKVSSAVPKYPRINLTIGDLYNGK